MVVINPLTNQTTSNSAGLSTCRAMPAETIKMPEPIIEPATIMLASSRPRLLINSEWTTTLVSFGGWLGSRIGQDAQHYTQCVGIEQLQYNGTKHVPGAGSNDRT